MSEEEAVGVVVEVNFNIARGIDGVNRPITSRRVSKSSSDLLIHQVLERVDIVSVKVIGAKVQFERQADVWDKSCLSIPELWAVTWLRTVGRITARLQGTTISTGRLAL